MDPKLLNQKSLNELARSVARSFSLTLKGIPQPQRNAITLTYLLARFADTIADSGAWPLLVRQQHLDQLEAAIIQLKPELWELKNSVEGFGASEATLLLAGRDLLMSFANLERGQLTAGQDVLKTLVGAMKWDLKTFGESKKVIAGCADRTAFEDYTYSIAGCVGAYWVQIFKLAQNLEPMAIAYGKALQRINIIRDVVSDFKINRVYLPVSELERFAFDCAKPLWLQPAWKDFVSGYLKETRDMLLLGAEFCDALPYLPLRLKWASALPLVIGFETLNAIERANTWDPPVKITRQKVKSLVFRSFIELVFKRSLAKKFRIQE